jgi:tRNA pseudouridine55 synthase
MNGVLLIDKPSGPTSFDVVRAVRRLLDERRVGHAGTLDPLASGLLVVGIGQGTKLIPFLMDSEKRYLARVALGAQTDTDDVSGEITHRAPVPKIEEEELRNRLKGFIGRIRQVPPVYSALKKNGEPLYRKARRGEEIALEAREVAIHNIEIVELEADVFSIDVRCGPGTYMRSLARDVAIALGTRGHLKSLRRTDTSGFNVEEALCFGDFESARGRDGIKDRVIPLSGVLRSAPKLSLSKEEQALVANGQPVALANLEDSVDAPLNSHVRLLDGDDRLVAVARREEHCLKPVRVFI